MQAASLPAELPEKPYITQLKGYRKKIKKNKCSIIVKCEGNDSKREYSKHGFYLCIEGILATTQRGRMGREMGGRFKRKGIYVYLRLTHVEIWQKQNFVKQLSFN